MLRKLLEKRIIRKNQKFLAAKNQKLLTKVQGYMPDFWVVDGPGSAYYVPRGTKLWRG